MKKWVISVLAIGVLGFSVIGGVSTSVALDEEPEITSIGHTDI